MHYDTMIKTAQWILVSAFFVFGCWSLFYANATMEPDTLILSVFSWGTAFIMSVFLLKLKRNTAFASMMLWGVSAFLSQKAYLPLWIYVYTGFRLSTYGHFYSWMFLIIFFCAPIMYFVIRRN